MKATGLFRWEDDGVIHIQQYSTSWHNTWKSDKLLRIRFYKYLINRGELFSNLELIESKVEP